MSISSRSNPRIKQIRGLRNRKEREQSGLFFIEGLRIVTEAVQTGADIETLIVTPQLLDTRIGQEFLHGPCRTRSPCLVVTEDVFASLASKETAHGIGAVVRQRWERVEDLHPSGELCWLALDGIQYPGNLGTILRTGDAVGCAGALLLGTTTDPYDPAAVRASTGAIFSQRLARASFTDFCAWKRWHRCTVVGTSPAAATDYQAVAYRPPVVLFMGCERHGLSAEEQALCDVTVRIPMVGRSDSLNLAVATGIVLCEIFNQRRHDFMEETGNGAGASGRVLSRAHGGLL
jgi:TrmH family RNA methyltransferase